MSNLQQNITRGQGIGLMATTLLGTGVFILPQLTVDIAGSGALLAWALLTLAILPLVRVFAELGRQFPHAAGPAYFVEQAFGAVFGRMIGLLFVMVVPIGTVAAMVMVMEFAGAMFTLTPLSELMGELVLIAGIWILNVRSVNVSARIQLTLTVLIAAVVVVLLALFGAEYGVSSAQAAIAGGSDFSVILMACGLAFWSFLGIEALSHYSSEFKDPQRDYVPAMIIGTLVVGILYLACAWLVLQQPRQESLAMVAVFDQLLGQGGRWVIGILGVASGLATINVYIGSVSRLCWSLSNQGHMPASLGRLNEHGVPERAATVVILVVMLSTVARHLFELPFELFLSWSNGVFVIIYGGSMLAALRLLNRSFHWASLIGLSVCGGIAIGLGGGMLYALTLVAGLWPVLTMQHKKRLSTCQGR